MKQFSFLAFSVCAGLLFANSAHAEGTACAELTNFQLPGFAVTITKAQQIPAKATSANSTALPAYCRADGVIDPRTGAEGRHYAIGFAVVLPEDWNGRFLYQGGGALNGIINEPLGEQAAGGVSALARGYAVVATDSGHQGSPFDASFFRDQQATLNFAYGALGKVTVVAKAVVAQYYGHAAHHAYFDGCSTGGREAMIVTQRYPDYFDGVLVGNPAMRTGFSRLGDQWVAVQFNQIAPKDASGVVSSGAFSSADKKLIVQYLLDRCDAEDGLRDGLISNPLACKFDPATLLCAGAKTDACLSAQQVDALHKGFAGAKNSRGDQVYPGFFYDTGIADSGGIPGLLTWGADPFGPANTRTAINVDALADAAWADPQAAITDPRLTNLSTFSAHGGKVIFYHGTSDPWFSSQDTLGYYQKMASANGGLQQVQQWSRFFLVPGMGHCNGGSATLDNFDLLGAVTDWVEKGIKPDAVTATGKDFPGRSRPLCAFPSHAQYRGQGDPESASNFECAE